MISRPTPVALAVLGALVASLLSLLSFGGAEAAAGSASTQRRSDKPFDITDVPVVAGRNGEYFLGWDFYTTCQPPEQFVKALKAYAGLARIIEKSGRRVVFTVAPNKSTALLGDVDPAQTPDGACDVQGLAAQRKILQRYDDPGYLSLLDPITNSRHQVYWKTDPHFTSAGGAMFAEAVARRLDPGLGRRQKYAYGSETISGMLRAALGNDTTETGETATPSTAVTVRTAPGATDWAGYPTLVYDHAWNSRPAARTYPGHTLLMGDSMMMYSLQSLRPLFRHGQFMWIGHQDEDIAAAVQKSDTVVLEVLQVFLPDTLLASSSLKKTLRRTLLPRG